MRYIKKYKYIITIILFVIIIIGSILLKNNLKEKNKKVETKETFNIEKEEVKEDKEEKVLISVDIKGEVKNPGVYTLENTKRVIDVINLSGGLTEQADSSLINLSKKILDEMVIIIYSKEEVKASKVSKVVDNTCVCPNIQNDGCINNDSDDAETKTKTNSSTSVKTNQKISINTATLEELLTLSGIGESKAEAIIKYREENGLFNTIEDIMNVSGIGQSVYDKIKENITT